MINWNCCVSSSHFDCFMPGMCVIVGGQREDKTLGSPWSWTPSPVLGVCALVPRSQPWEREVSLRLPGCCGWLCLVKASVNLSDSGGSVWSVVWRPHASLVCQLPRSPHRPPPSGLARLSSFCSLPSKCAVRGRFQITPRKLLRFPTSNNPSILSSFWWI